jgi:isopenicillin N synthase-like dioxygenase
VVSGHGLDAGVVDAALAEAKALFALPKDAKRAYHVVGGAGQRGYTPFGVETAKGHANPDLKEFWHVGRDLPAGHAYAQAMPANIWPAERPSFRPAMLALYAALEGLGGRLMSAIGQHLGTPPGFLEDATADGNSVLRLLHYPPVDGRGPAIRAGAHEDINAITLLLGAEEAGLEILDRDGAWLPIDPPAGAVVVNIGDMLSRLTNDVLPSTTHRVINPRPERAGVARYSMPFFLHFRPDFEIRTLAQCVSHARPNRYPGPITADAFLRQRLEDLRLA